MISASKLKRKLRTAIREWTVSYRRADLSGQEGYFPGVIRGLREAIQIVGECHREEVVRLRQTRHKISKPGAASLYAACRSALGRLQHSDRLGAMKILQRVLSPGGKVLKA